MHVEGIEDKQLLNKAKEIMLVKQHTELTKNGFLPWKKPIEEMLMEIIW
jgi:hypothetical protein